MTRKAGDAIPPFSILVTPEAMKAWAPILRDPNPIHLDPEVVRAKGLGDRVINQGPANVAYVVNALKAAFPQGRIRALDMRFLDNVYGGETVSADGTVAAVEEAAGERLTRCDMRLVTADGRAVLSGTAVVAEPLA